jgi:cation-transporting ATPase E
LAVRSTEVYQLVSLNRSWLKVFSAPGCSSARKWVWHYTTNRLRFEALDPLGRPESEVGRLLGDYVASAADSNRTAEALAAACGGQARPTVEQVPFSSERKWRVLASEDAAVHGVYVLGAPEVLQPSLWAGTGVGARCAAWVAQGLRVVLLAYRPELTALRDAQDEPCLPADLIPLSLVSLRDELRPDVQATLAGFAEAGVCLKIIGRFTQVFKNPNGETALAIHAG